MDICIHDIDRCFRSNFVDYLSSPELVAEQWGDSVGQIGWLAQSHNGSGRAGLKIRWHGSKVALRANKAVGLDAVMSAIQASQKAFETS